jgi:hypothetical protein
MFIEDMTRLNLTREKPFGEKNPSEGIRVYHPLSLNCLIKNLARKTSGIKPW